MRDVGSARVVGGQAAVPAPTVLWRVARLSEPAGIASPVGAAVTAGAQYHPSLQGRLLLPSQGGRQAASRKG